VQQVESLKRKNERKESRLERFSGNADRGLARARDEAEGARFEGIRGRWRKVQCAKPTDREADSRDKDDQGRNDEEGQARERRTLVHAHTCVQLCERSPRTITFTRTLCTRTWRIVDYCTLAREESRSPESRARAVD